MAFAGVEVLKGIDLDLFPGEVHGVIGENGAGKSTMGKLVAGVYRPTGGTISINGEARNLGSPRQAMELGVALIHQEPLTFPDLDVAENIFIGRQPMKSLRRVDWNAMSQRAGELLGSLGVALDPKAKVRGLSVADQQMVELAAALSQNAKVLILDETTASLTPKEVEELFVIVRRLREQGCAIAFVSHRLDEVFAICDRITVLRDGEKVGERIPKESSIAEIIRMMVGRELSLEKFVAAQGVQGEVRHVQVRGEDHPGRGVQRPRGAGLDGRPVAEADGD
jgi:rhamnose transport system ATP-binding protein